jgi:hypothetical protein
MSIPVGLLAASVAFVEPRPDESWVTGVRNAALVFAILTVAMGFLWCVAAGASVRCNKLVADFPHPSGRVGGFRCSIGGRADVLTLQPTDSHLLAELDSGGAFAIPWHLVRRPRVQQTSMGEAVLFGTPAGTIKVFPSIDATAIVEQFEERMSPRS